MVESTPIIDQSDPPDTPEKKTRFRAAIIVSVVAHLALLVFLLFKYLPSGANNQPSSQASNATPTESRPEPPQPASSGSVSAEQIQKSIDAQIEQVEKIPDEQKLSELERNLKRLESVASTESIVETGTTVASKLGLDTSQYSQKQKPASGEFDADTAQLTDVKRRKDDAGQWQYESVLVDAGGREMTVAMSADEGETVYKTFETMERYPMAQGIYRGVVMPLLQKMMEAKEAASKIEMPDTAEIE